MSDLMTHIDCYAFFVVTVFLLLKWRHRRRREEQEDLERMKKIIQDVDADWDRILREIFEQSMKAVLEAPRTQSWETVLGLSLPVNETQVRAAFRSLSKIRHPDAGGTKESMQALVQARDQALQWIAKNSSKNNA